MLDFQSRYLREIKIVKGGTKSESIKQKGRRHGFSKNSLSFKPLAMVKETSISGINMVMRVLQRCLEQCSYTYLTHC